MNNQSTIGFIPRGVIFDVDDTLLNNYPSHLSMGLHEQARYYATKEIGQKYNVPELIELSQEFNRQIPRRAREHTVEGSTWQLLYELGLVDTPEIDHSNTLLREISTRKHELYEPILREFGAPIPQAAEFVKAISFLTNGHIAIASGAQHNDVATFLQVTELSDLFMRERIFCLGDYEKPKPDPSSFDAAFCSLSLAENCRPEVLAFEDDPKGVESAKRAGLFTCAITTKYTEAELMTHEYKPDIVRASYREYAEVLGIIL